jgi:PIN domain nuclease of toxin-antitoxin system
VNGGLLVDTHIFVWTRLGPHRLTVGESHALDEARTRFVSAVSLWEIAILQSLRRIELDPELLKIPVEFDFLPVQPDHCKAVLGLPMHHRDPFDRMLIAQAQCEQVPLLTRDRAMTAYSQQATILRFPGA